MPLTFVLFSCAAPTTSFGSTGPDLVLVSSLIDLSDGSLLLLNFIHLPQWIVVVTMATFGLRW